MFMTGSHLPSDVQALDDGHVSRTTYLIEGDGVNTVEEVGRGGENGKAPRSEPLR